MPHKILIADDNQFILEILSHMLINSGYDVVAVNTGKDVIDAVQANNPDLLILDAQLPDADGRELCQLLKSTPSTKNLPIIICSGRADIHDCLYQQNPPNDVLPKPFDMDFLVDKVRRQLIA
ncbi:response regulator [Mucilaginibacter sp. KACC 22063]|uniref:response regulator n=1 Tax=Mucilaginibacter sp. KACC 22063 TaxID=3025666 RepID=UPI00236660A3|nr:response regulator [Mucilaginibacter sp. KACC 22063]WDF55406.1 response regulator [Mucilaginibacter sp. KACC 22063]